MPPGCPLDASSFARATSADVLPHEGPPIKQCAFGTEYNVSVWTSLIAKLSIQVRPSRAWPDGRREVRQSIWGIECSGPPPRQFFAIFAAKPPADNPRRKPQEPFRGRAAPRSRGGLNSHFQFAKGIGLHICRPQWPREQTSIPLSPAATWPRPFRWRAIPPSRSSSR